MKFDDGVNGLFAVLVGVAMIVYSISFPAMAHIDYGPGFFPTLVGAGFVLAGGALIARRVFAGGGAIPGLVHLRANGLRGFAGFFVMLGAVLFYVLLVESLGFLLTAVIVVFSLVYWFDRRLWRAVAVAIVGTFVFHSFFYQIMSAPLPWGPLEPYAGILSW